MIAHGNTGVVDKNPVFGAGQAYLSVPLPAFAAEIRRTDRAIGNTSTLIDGESFIASCAGAGGCVESAAEIAHGNACIIRVFEVEVRAFEALTFDPVPGFAAEVGGSGSVGG